MIKVPDASAALAYLSAHTEDHLRQLDEFLRIESVSADPGRAGEVRRAAEWLGAELSRIGFENATVHDTSSHPIVTADWLHAGRAAPTVLMYGHYDVQPADPLDEWVRPPFEPRYEDGRIYARGSGDDKGQLFTHLKAAEAWLSTSGALPVNVKVMFEGDEEIGSAPMADFMRRHRDLLAADLMVVSDSTLFDDDETPQITYSMRGMAYFEVHVSGPSRDLHSGHYGGAVANPANVLAGMLAGLKDDRGRITIPGFYDRVRELTDAERAAHAGLEVDEEALREEVGVPALDDGEQGYSVFERRSVRPTLDVNGIWGGYSGAGAKTIIPARASAKLSVRLVPDQDFREIGRMVVEHLQRIAPATVRVEAKLLHAGAPALTPVDHPAVGVAAQALEAAFGKPPVLSRGGGSIPMLADAEEILGIKSVLVGFAAANGNFHSPNEWIPVTNVTRGMQTIVHLWKGLAEAGAEELRGA
ncbi:dipeptidase [Dactylosporangium salmoneum]|uniref:Dipeptidase n=1 Tax=Dactylosporangium salmoneum TaxID=53361 RepID=A0ABN3HQP4_9ACTN